jgi:hypothetical protein
MTVSILDLHCLNAVCDDYENIESITAEVRRSSHGNVSAHEVAECLAEMAAARLVTVFRFDARSGRYEPLSPATLTADAVQTSWFLISPIGQRELDANWVED